MSFSRSVTACRMNFQELQNISDLLDKSYELAEEKQRQAQAAAKKIAPKPVPAPSTESKPKPKSNAIWEDETEIMQADSVITDSRMVPSYEMVYNQSISAAEMYGGFEMLTSATEDCQAVDYIVSMPGEDPSTLDIDVTATHLSVMSRRYRLVLPLAHPVVESGTKARWDKGREAVVITVVKA
ncbi:hypothetical protein J8273_1047 [Carpediemonas membranifera]|uniref:PIH1D1/2/3 CS-like domain-containing protein n=1 Tax=Carpediemonas membranifera TaxID=201153 RepID=A0A8J6AYF5_9EUKA|nr:hypothetical protein J8273_1047 [Carpediemonas membranifera]|eukprot:KAG9397138.1 hypothetical protein J8273_1047 [Carpediemonas membranifera]